ncbi:FAD-dependent oxidoreductase [Candidatus Woesearchaeota archaeon]|nr:FAD-dependent oxidoreductase [Candidatus Woesearchaeota archaeon]
MTRIVVVGAGIAGLSCAYELQKAGYAVEVFEKNNYVGGRMATRIKDGLAFDIGANFFVRHYRNTYEYCKELGIAWQPMGYGRHYTFKDGGYDNLELNGLWSALNYTSVPFFARCRMIFLFLYAKHQAKGLNFFDLSTAPTEFDSMTAYDFAARLAGKDVADYLIDGFTSTYQFHGAKEISLTAMLSLLELMANKAEGFELCHTIGEMSALPEALAKKLTVYKKTPVTAVTGGKNVTLVSARGKETIDAIVIASTANFTKEMYQNPSPTQRKLLDAVKYASTINVSFKVPVGTLKDIAAVTVPYVQSKAISEYTQESTKGQTHNGKTLVNIGLHEDYARSIMDKSDDEIFALVKNEFMRVCPLLQGDVSLLKNNDLQRWPQAMPKFDYRYVSLVKKFWGDGQGDNNVFFCGDYLNTPWVEGSILCGKKVATLIKDRLK